MKKPEILSLGYTSPSVECSKERWAEIFRDFNARARNHAANLAAHNWDVLLVDGRVFLSSFWGWNGHWLAPDATRQDATDSEIESLYERSEGGGKKRRFA